MVQEGDGGSSSSNQGGGTDAAVAAPDAPLMHAFVSHTALLVCAHRVQESRRPDALFKDPVAELMVPEVI